MNRLQDFFKTVDSTEPLSDSEVLVLSRRARSGDEGARDQLWRSHLRLIAHIARRFYRSDGFFDWGDLMQQGSLGLLRAMDRFDPSRQCSGRPVSFALYSTYWIAHAIRREIQNRGRTVKLPVYLQQELTHWRQEMRGMRSKRRKRSSGELQRLALAEQTFYPLDSTPAEESEQAHRSSVHWLGDWDSCEQELMQFEVGLAVRKLVNELPEREGYIVQKSYGIAASETSHKKLALELGLSAERIRQLQNRGLARLKEALRLRPELHPDTV